MADESLFCFLISFPPLFLRTVLLGTKMNSQKQLWFGHNNAIRKLNCSFLLNLLRFRKCLHQLKDSFKAQYIVLAFLVGIYLIFTNLVFFGVFSYAEEFFRTVNQCVRTVLEDDATPNEVLLYGLHLKEVKNLDTLEKKRVIFVWEILGINFATLKNQRRNNNCSMKIC